jgi:hypothetical protein
MVGTERSSTHAKEAWVTPRLPALTRPGRSASCSSLAAEAAGTTVCLHPGPTGCPLPQKCLLCRKPQLIKALTATELWGCSPSHGLISLVPTPFTRAVVQSPSLHVKCGADPASHHGPSEPGPSSAWPLPFPTALPFSAWFPTQPPWCKPGISTSQHPQWASFPCQNLPSKSQRQRSYRTPVSAGSPCHQASFPRGHRAKTSFPRACE